MAGARPSSLMNAPPKLSSLFAMRRAGCGSLVRGSLFDGDDTSITRRIASMLTAIDLAELDDMETHDALHAYAALGHHLGLPNPGRSSLLERGSSLLAAPWEQAAYDAGLGAQLRSSLFSMGGLLTSGTGGGSLLQAAGGPARGASVAMRQSIMRSWERMLTQSGDPNCFEDTLMEFLDSELIAPLAEGMDGISEGLTPRGSLAAAAAHPGPHSGAALLVHPDLMAPDKLAAAWLPEVSGGVLGPQRRLDMPYGMHAPDANNGRHKARRGSLFTPEGLTPLPPLPSTAQSRCLPGAVPHAFAAQGFAPQSSAPQSSALHAFAPQAFALQASAPHALAPAHSAPRGAQASQPGAPPKRGAVAAVALPSGSLSDTAPEEEESEEPPESPPSSPELHRSKRRRGNATTPVPPSKRGRKTAALAAAASRRVLPHMPELVAGRQQAPKQLQQKQADHSTHTVAKMTAQSVAEGAMVSQLQALSSSLGGTLADFLYLCGFDKRTSAELAEGDLTSLTELHHKRGVAELLRLKAQMLDVFWDGAQRLAAALPCSAGCPSTAVAEGGAVAVTAEKHGSSELFVTMSPSGSRGSDDTQQKQQQQQLGLLAAGPLLPSGGSAASQQPELLASGGSGQQQQQQPQQQKQQQRAGGGGTSSPSASSSAARGAVAAALSTNRTGCGTVRTNGGSPQVDPQLSASALGTAVCVLAEVRGVLHARFEERLQTSALQLWAALNLLNPKPTRAQKEAIGAYTGKSAKQVTDWFTNFRARRWKPAMVNLTKAVLGGDRS
ncbi:hypothetical protein FOA52_015786 [Chlamydomonas sp. UWO 241]|nr:hypothetical protein FOA52_015786 [Chlamydomonas sp. UWO 241]